MNTKIIPLRTSSMSDKQYNEALLQRRRDNSARWRKANPKYSTEYMRYYRSL